METPSEIHRQVLLESAMNHTARGGFSGLSMRGVAAAVEIHPETLYQHFGDRLTLEAALKEKCVGRLHSELKRATGNKPPAEAIRSLAQSYVRFAREQPEMFTLTMMPYGIEGLCAGAHVELWQFVLLHVGEIYGKAKAVEAGITLWSLLQGTTVLEAAGAFGGQIRTSSFEFGLQMWINAAQST